MADMAPPVPQQTADRLGDRGNEAVSSPGALPLNASPRVTALLATASQLNASPAAAQCVRKAGGVRVPATLSANFKARHVAEDDHDREICLNQRFANNNGVRTNTTATATAWKAAVNASGSEVPNDRVAVTVEGVDTTKSAAGVFTHGELGNLDKNVGVGLTQDQRNARVFHVSS